MTSSVDNQTLATEMPSNRARQAADRPVPIGRPIRGDNGAILGQGGLAVAAGETVSCVAAGRGWRRAMLAAWN